MKICNCVKNSIWYDPRVRKQISEYVRRGVEVVAVGCMCPRYIKSEVDKIECPVSIAKISPDYFKSGLSVFKKLYREMSTNYQMFKLIVDSKADIIHANDLNALIPAYFASKKLKAKLVYDSHEIFIENPWVARFKVLHDLLFIVERKLLRKTDLLINVSNASSDYMNDLYRIKSRVVVTNCISQTTLSTIKMQVKNEGFEVLNHGQFYEGRGYDVMVQAALLLTDIPDVKLVLRGFGSMEERLRKDALQLGCSNVVFAPPVKTSELICCASASHVGIAITEQICLNFKLSISNKIFEYAAAGLPVIMSNIPEHRYLNEKYHFGIILENDTPECLAAAIKMLYFDRKLYNEFSANAKRLSLEITWEKEFQKLIDAESHLLMN